MAERKTMEIKKDIKTTLNAKEVWLDDGVIVNEDGEVVDVIKLAEYLFGDEHFKLTLSATKTEDLTYEKDDEE